MSGPLAILVIFAIGVAIWGFSGRLGHLFAPRGAWDDADVEANADASTPYDRERR